MSYATVAAADLIDSFEVRSSVMAPSARPASRHMLPAYAREEANLILSDAR